LDLDVLVHFEYAGFLILAVLVILFLCNIFTAQDNLCWLGGPS
jgi:hypothetical protein